MKTTLTGQENLSALFESYPFLQEEFLRQGLGKYCSEDSLNYLGRYLRVQTILEKSQINVAVFLDKLNTLIAEESKEIQPENLAEAQKHLDFIAMMPCGVQMPFKNKLEAFFAEHESDFADLKYIAEGNVNHEISFYPHLDHVEDVNDLPDVIIASDINNFFHKPFMERFVQPGIFQEYLPFGTSPYLEQQGFRDPRGYFTMLASNMLVMVVDKTQLGDRPVPKHWDDLLDPIYQKDIILRGEGDFFCNAVMLPYYKDGGTDKVAKLAPNIKAGMHPAQMAKLAGTGQVDGAAVSVMPYFFASKITKQDKIEIVWPEEGAVCSPVFMLVKKGTEEKHKKLLDFLTGAEMAKLFEVRECPTLLAGTDNKFPGEKVLWLGWDFLLHNDIAAVKKTIEKTICRT